MKLHVRSLVLGSVLLLGAVQGLAVTITPNPSDAWVGYMNVFEIPQNGGAYLWGSSWGTPDLCAVWSGPVLTLTPNTIGDPNPYWYTPSGQPGCVGNKFMDANMYVDTTGLYSGQNVRFTGTVVNDTLLSSQDALGNGWTSVAFIKDFAPDYSSYNIVSAPLVNGVFDINMDTIADPTRHVQWGFETVGPDVWITDVGQYGSIQITPEPTSLMLGLVLVGLASRRR